MAGAPANLPAWANAAPIPSETDGVGPTARLRPRPESSSAIGFERCLRASKCPEPLIFSRDLWLKEFTFVKVFDSDGAAGGLRTGIKRSVSFSSKGERHGLSKLITF